MMKAEIKPVVKGKKISLSDLKKKECESCAHFGVCLIVRAMANLLQEPNFTKDTLPFQVGDLAHLCKYYKHISIYELKGDEP